MSRAKAQQRRMVEEARKRLLDAVERKLVVLETAFSGEEASEANVKCLRDDCEVERQCREVLREAACIFRDSKGAFRSKRLANLRERIEDSLKEEKEQIAPKMGK